MQHQNSGELLNMKSDIFTQFLSWSSHDLLQTYLSASLIVPLRRAPYHCHRCYALHLLRRECDSKCELTWEDVRRQGQYQSHYLILSPPQATQLPFYSALWKFQCQTGTLQKNGWSFGNFSHFLSTKNRSILGVNVGKFAKGVTLCDLYIPENDSLTVRLL